MTPVFHPWWPDGWPHPHLIFEILAYSGGFQLFLYLRRRQGDPGLEPEQRVWLLASAVLGGALGSKLLFLAEDPGWTWRALTTDPAALMGGKTVVGGFLGGLVAVELAKKALGVARSTGDAFVAPLILGLVLGRLGCFLSGIADGTHGLPTQVPWGMDLGDGIPRHPAALYEIAWVLALGGAVLLAPAVEDGARFRRFLSGYLAFRLVAETWKTQPFPYLGLSAIQLACVAGLAWYARLALRRRWAAEEV